MAMPPPPGHTEVVDDKLTPDETSHILDVCLAPVHRADPNILRFIDSYIRCRHTGQAAKEAGLPSSAAGYNLLRKPDVFAAITKLTEKAVMKYGYSAEETIERVKELANFDPLELEAENGAFKTKLSQIAPEARRAIKKLKLKNTYFLDPNNEYIRDSRGQRIVETEVIEVETWDKIKPIEMLGGEKELFKKSTKVEHDITANMRNFLLESQQRAAQRGVALAERPALAPPIDVTPIINEDGDKT